MKIKYFCDCLISVFLKHVTPRMGQQPSVVEVVVGNGPNGNINLNDIDNNDDDIESAPNSELLPIHQSDKKIKLLCCLDSIKLETSELSFKVFSSNPSKLHAVVYLGACLNENRKIHGGYGWGFAFIPIDILLTVFPQGSN